MKRFAGGRRGFDARRQWFSSLWSRRFRSPDVLTARKAPPARQVQTERKVRPATRAMPGLPGRPVRPVPPGATGLHALRQNCAAGSNCDLTCSPGEKLISATCPGGTLQITRNADIEFGIVQQQPRPGLGAVHETVKGCAMVRGA